MTDNQVEKLNSEEELSTQEELEEARNVLFQDVDKEAAEKLSSSSRSPAIRRLNFPINRDGTQGATPMSQVASANKKRLEQMMVERARQIKEKDNKMSKPLQFLDSKHIDSQAYGDDASVTFRRVDQEVLKEIDLDSLNEKISSDYDLLMQKVSLLEDELCKSMKKKLEAERNYKLAESKLDRAYKELYATVPEEDKVAEASALEEMLSREFLKDRF